ncbi:MAG: UbiX family flavin prenyltransferase [Acidobacteriota bacterium]|nr:UbiX family flavin prenyltransferase [Acidobacteriota bacterium]
MNGAGHSGLSNLNLTLAVTGASGSVFAVEMLRAAAGDPRIARVNLVASEAALRVFAEELGVSGRSHLAEKLLGAELCGKIEQLAEGDVGANIASGSYRSDAMIVLPCSMGTLAGIAHGMAGNLIERAADVCLKERRPLVLCVRETPFNLIHLRNMQQAAEAGATIYPVMPTLYNKPQDTTEMARQFVYRVLAHLGVPQPGAYEWKPD